MASTKLELIDMFWEARGKERQKEKLPTQINCIGELFFPKVMLKVGVNGCVGVFLKAKGWS